VDFSALINVMNSDSSTLLLQNYKLQKEYANNKTAVSFYVGSFSTWHHSSTGCRWRRQPKDATNMFIQ